MEEHYLWPFFQLGTYFFIKGTASEDVFKKNEIILLMKLIFFSAFGHLGGGGDTYSFYWSKFFSALRVRDVC